MAPWFAFGPSLCEPVPPLPPFLFGSFGSSLSVEGPSVDAFRAMVKQTLR